MKKIVLIGGPMGVGKSTVGKALSDKFPNAVYLEGDLGWKNVPFILNDENKKKVLNNIIDMINNALNDYEVIILGWVLDYQSTIDYLIKDITDTNIYSFSLLANEETITQRLENDIKNNIRKDDGVIQRSLSRIKRYDDVCSFKIDTSFISVEQVVNLIERMMNK